jgi:hypothetical protein
MTVLEGLSMKSRQAEPRWIDSYEVRLFEATFLFQLSLARGAECDTKVSKYSIGKIIYWAWQNDWVQKKFVYLLHLQLCSLGH